MSLSIDSALASYQLKATLYRQLICSPCTLRSAATRTTTSEWIFCFDHLFREPTSTVGQFLQPNLSQILRQMCHFIQTHASESLASDGLYVRPGVNSVSNESINQQDNQVMWPALSSICQSSEHDCPLLDVLEMSGDCNPKLVCPCFR